MEIELPQAPRKVSYRQGGRWIVQAFYLVRDQPLTWMLFAALYVLIQMTIGAVPVIGQFASMILVPVFAGGFVLAAQKAARGETLRLIDLFSACQASWQRLLMLGVAYVSLLVMLMVVLAAVLIMLFGAELKTGDAMRHSPVLMMAIMVLLAVCTFVASLSYWFAPAEMVLRETSPFVAMKRSMAAGLLNWRAMLYCCLLLGLLFVLALLPFGLGLLLWLPVMFVAVYMAWLDVFGDGLPQQ